jgi:hypothetical protein
MILPGLPLSLETGAAGVRLLAGQDLFQQEMVNDIENTGMFVFVSSV